MQSVEAGPSQVWQSSSQLDTVIRTSLKPRALMQNF